MKKPIVRLAALCLVALTPVHMASAQSAEPALTVPNPASLQLAREILDLAMPEENREAIFFAIMDQTLAQVRTAQKNTGLANDPAIDAIVDEHLERLRLEGQVIMSAHLPSIMQAWAFAYANMFTFEELRDIRAFVATPSGQRFFELSPAIIAEPNFAAANQIYMESALELLPQFESDLSSALREYRSSHPAETEES